MPASDAPLTRDETLLDDLLDSWRRNNIILVNLLRALPDEALDLRGAADSPTVLQLFMHMHYCRMVFVQEAAPEVPAVLPEGEWRAERDRDRVAALLHESADAMREAVRGRLLAGRPMDEHYDHPILMLQHFVWHEGYHHGQIKLVLKMAGQAFDDEAIGEVTWDVWMKKGVWATARSRPAR